MKALYCANCGTIMGLPQDTSEWGCRCGLVYARWIDPRKGTCVFVEFDTPARGRDLDHLPPSLDTPHHAWLLGINNAVLRGAQRDRGPSYLEYRDWQNADGTLFKTYETNIIRVRPGESSDSRLVGADEFFAPSRGGVQERTPDAPGASPAGRGNGGTNVSALDLYADDITECDACGDPEDCGARSWCYEYESPLVEGEDASSVPGGGDQKEPA